MSTSGLVVTVVGWVASNPREVVGDGVPFTSFRLATTPRWYDNRAAMWTDGRTEWITVKAFRDVAFNVASSVRKGDPLVVLGRLRTEEWAGENGPRTTLVLDASALGHDLTRGRTSFARSVHVSADRSGDGADGADGAGDGVADGASSGEPVDPWAVPADVDPDEAASAGEAGANDKAGALTP